VANLHPAVLEAAHAGLPLVVLSADRPAGLRGTNANQTTDQVKIFGGAVRSFADVPPGFPGASEAAQVASWRSLVARTVATAQGRTAQPAGPVHINAQFTEPLTPDLDDGWSTDCAGRADGTPWTTSDAPVEGRLEPPDDDRPTVLVAGDDAGPPARILAEQMGWPLLAEPTSGSRTGPNAIRTYRLLLADPDLADRIERVVVCGHPTLSRPVTRLLSRHDVEVIASPSATGWTDPGHNVSRVLAHGTFDAEQSSSASRSSSPDAWLREWLDRDEVLSAALDELLDKQDELTPHHVAAAVAAALPPTGLLFVGASNPVRDLDLMVPRYTVGERRLVIANRGLAGIDGSVSSAVGAALGRERTSRAFALLGDVTFLHDCNGLLLGPDEARPDLMIVVVNDDGGSIFASLEQGAPSYASSFDKLFGTPHRTDLAALCAASGTPHRRVTTHEELVDALDDPQGGIEVVEAVVRRDNRRDLDAAIRDLAGRDAQA
jgi:2-succinyl-5-enolpyruvyl-6-hydroxy-3-cyclohexene-1-carboxylate synthase